MESHIRTNVTSDMTTKGIQKLYWITMMQHLINSIKSNRLYHLILTSVLRTLAAEQSNIAQMLYKCVVFPMVTVEGGLF